MTGQGPQVPNQTDVDGKFVLLLPLGAILAAKTNATY